MLTYFGKDTLDPLWAVKEPFLLTMLDLGRSVSLAGLSGIPLALCFSIDFTSSITAKGTEGADGGGRVDSCFKTAKAGSAFPR